jgi:hypothetical protein
MQRLPTTALTCLIAMMVVPVLAAQVPVTGTGTPSIAVSVGVSQFDLSGTGNALHVAARVLRPLRSAVLFEIGAGVTRLDPSGGETSYLVTPEVQLQLQYVAGRLAPYLGAGGGLALDLGDRGSDVEPTLSAATGLRIGLTSAVAFAAELRVRGIGSKFEGAAAEWTAGLAWRP